MTNLDVHDQTCITLIFALRDSLTDDGPSRLDFWQGRAASALETAAAGSATWAEAVTAACRKLQIDVLTADASRAVTAAEPADYEAWAAHVSRNLVYIVALARVENDTRKTAKAAKRGTDQEPAF